MSRQIQYTDEPIGDFRQVVDFLPSPEELKLKSETTKITISLSSESLAYFKEVARANHIQYQKMIRQLLDDYVARRKGAGE
ncbi:MAG: CopG family transcriptional regulator [Gammaproteobacteria bacterium]|nr:CopG family transcriptional regulator [Gammaproteobacteria bacterium]